MTDSNNKQNTEMWMCAIAYILFFIPLIVIPNSQAGKFHANQGLTLLILTIAISVVGSIIGLIPFLGFIGWILISLGSVFCLILAIMGIINALNKEEKKLPIIGEYTLLK